MQTHYIVPILFSIGLFFFLDLASSWLDSTLDKINGGKGFVIPLPKILKITLIGGYAWLAAFIIYKYQLSGQIVLFLGFPALALTIIVLLIEALSSIQIIKKSTMDM